MVASLPILVKDRIGLGLYLRRTRSVTSWERGGLSGYEEQCRNGGWRGGGAGSRDWRKSGNYPQDPSKYHRSTIEDTSKNHRNITLTTPELPARCRLGVPEPHGGASGSGQIGRAARWE